MNGSLRLLPLRQDHLKESNSDQIQDLIEYLNPDLILINSRKSFDSNFDIPCVTVEPGLTLSVDFGQIIVTKPEKLDSHQTRSSERSIFILIFRNQNQDIRELKTITATNYPGSSVFLSLSHPAGTTIPPRIKQESQRLIGIACDRNEDQTFIPLIVINSSGHAYCEEKISLEKTGLRAIKGIGRKKSSKLHSEGFQTRPEILRSSPERLLDIRGVGPHYASIAYAGSYAHENHSSVWFDENPIDSGKVAYLDIETDSRVSVIWQIGVYDEPTDQYRYFIETMNKNDPRPVPRAFARWVYEEIPDRTILAWYGSGFDYPHLTRFINRFADKKYVEHWNSLKKVDLLQDIVRSRTSVPARSHKLDVVSSRLGYKRNDGGLSGADAAKTYENWLRGYQPNWDQWIEYCKDDVVSMKHILDQLRKAEKIIDIKTIRKAYTG